MGFFHNHLNIIISALSFAVGVFVPGPKFMQYKKEIILILNELERILIRSSVNGDKNIVHNDTVIREIHRTREKI